jgi:hypothetical protein
MKMGRLLVMIGMVLGMSGCSTIRFGSRDEERSASERRERNEASRERAQGARLSTGGYERKED